MSRDLPLRAFSRPHMRPTQDTRTRLAGAGLTGILYAILVLLALLPLSRARPPVETEITASLMTRPKERSIEPLPFDLIKPRAELPAKPVIIIAPEAAPRLSASETQTSPLLGGPSGSGAGGQGGGNGAGGSGGGGCLDAVWMRAVSERVRQFFYYPPAALAVRKTGLVMVHFGVRRDGQIERLRISKSSGDAGLDKAALDIVQKAQPLPPIPERMQTDRVEGELPINFGLRSFNGSSTTGTCS